METADTGLPIHQTKNVLIPRASHNFEFFAEVCQQMNGKTYPVDDKMLNYTLVQPVGVCALVSPWNVPFMTATWKVAPCLALGNTAVLKMSELSPLTADPLAWRYGLYSVPPVMESVASLYDRLLDQLLLPPLVKRMEYVLSDAIARQDSKAAYDALHVYLLLNLDKDHEDKYNAAGSRQAAVSASYRLSLISVSSP